MILTDGAKLFTNLIILQNINEIDMTFINKNSFNWFCNDIIHYQRPPLSTDMYNSINEPSTLDKVICTMDNYKCTNYIPKYAINAQRTK